MTTLDIHHALKQSIVDGVAQDDWIKAFYRIERQDEMQAFGIGQLVTEEGYIIDFEAYGGDDAMFDKMGDAIEELYQISTQGSNNKWNLLYFILHPGGAFEVEYALDEGKTAVLAAVNASRSASPKERDALLTKIEDELSQAKSLQLYQRISQALAALPEGKWQNVQLQVERGGGVAKLSGKYLSSEGAEEEVAVHHSWVLVKNTHELGEMGSLHPNWNKILLTVLPTGEYKFLFDWEDQGSAYPSTNSLSYTREGHWQEPS